MNINQYEQISKSLISIMETQLVQGETQTLQGQNQKLIIKLLEEILEKLNRLP